MNHEEIIESVYEVDTVEGVALFSPQGELVENQLSLAEDSVLKIGQILLQMKNDLASAERLLKGLLIGSDKQFFLVYLHGEELLLLQLSKMTRSNQVYTGLKSILGEAKAPIPTLPVQAVASQAAVQEVQEVQPVAEEVAAGGIDWSVLRNKFLSAFKRVAPIQLAKKILKESAASCNVSDMTLSVSLEQAEKIAFSASEKIPNAARREMLQKELRSILQNS